MVSHDPLQKHALEDENSEVLQNVQFDAHQNEIVEIGTNIELVNVSHRFCLFVYCASSCCHINIAV